MRQLHYRLAWVLTVCVAGCAESVALSPDAGAPLDRDGDGVADGVDNCPAVRNPLQEDADANGVGDACEAAACSGFGSDLDRDDVCDARDNCPDVPNRSQQDADGDGVGDLCDPTPEPCDDQGGDTDGDRVCGALDNCPDEANAAQLDQDGDGQGDVCDASPVPLPPAPCAGRGGDADDDDVCQAGDNCPTAANPDQRDADADGTGDACDATPNVCDDLGGDVDRDTVCGAVDNCPEVSNVNQIDDDRDGVGDICDPTPPVDPVGDCAGEGGDLDDDEWCGVADNCPNDANPRQDDTDGDGRGDACDPEVCDGGDDDGDGRVDEGVGDEDADGVADCLDRCPDAPDEDRDADGLVDCDDPCLDDASNDVDSDNVCGAMDNCPLRANSSQSDRDADGLGDACDVETCDGLNNDADTRTDEDLPDEDEDGVCDEIDPCMGDRLNDPDSDGVCGLVDNCFAFANGDQTDADGDGAGDACDLDFVCDPSAPLAAPGEVPLPTLSITAIVGDPVRPIVYAATSTGTFGNSVVAIDPATRSVLWHVVVGSGPAVLAIAEDGSRLYVGLSGASSVRMISLEARAACRSFSMGSGTYGQRYAGDIAVLPGEPGTVVIATLRRGVSPPHDGVFVLEEGQRRPDHTDDHTGATAVAATSASVAYGYNQGSSEFGFRQLAIDAYGVREAWVTRGLVSGYSNDLIARGGRVYMRTGEVIDPAVPTVLGTLPSGGPVEVAPEIGRAFTATGSAVLVSDLSTYLAVRTLPYPAGTSSPTAITRAGPQGLALLSTSGLVFLAGVVVP